MLKSKKGAEFDKAYIEMMLDDHKEDIEQFSDEASKGTDADVKAFATKTLPVLNKHLEHVKSIDATIKK
jgi:putative membrane protein